MCIYIYITCMYTYTYTHFTNRHCCYDVYSILIIHRHDGSSWLGSSKLDECLSKEPQSPQQLQPFVCLLSCPFGCDFLRVSPFFFLFERNQEEHRNPFWGLPIPMKDTHTHTHRTICLRHQPKKRNGPLVPQTPFV